MFHQPFCLGPVRISAARSSVSTFAHLQRVGTGGGLSRRSFLAGGGGAIIGVVAAGGKAAKPPSLAAYHDGPQVWVRLGNRILTSYRAHPSQKYPYFFPLAGPVTGLSLTAETELPWPHHRSLFLACDHVNGANYWQDAVHRGQIVSSGPRIEAAPPGSVMILDHGTWRVPGEPAMLTDERRFTVATTGADRWSIDADLRLTAQTDVTVHKNNHSFFAIRAAHDVAPSGGGELVNANGQRGEKETFGR